MLWSRKNVAFTDGNIKPLQVAGSPQLCRLALYRSTTTLEFLTNDAVMSWGPAHAVFLSGPKW